MKTIIVVGGGASGLAAAFTAAEDRNSRVLLLEGQQRVGRKLLSTGNGRCNLTNTLPCDGHYHGKSPSFASFALERFPAEETIAFFRKLGLLTVEEYGGRVYPLSDSANSVVDILRFACERAGVELRTSCRVTKILRNGSCFFLEAGGEQLEADCVIIACGGSAGAKLGGVRDGYDLLCSLGHSRTPLFPALVQITTEPDYPRALKGVRADAAVRIESGGKILAESAGELQFTDRGVSGPAAFDVSRSVSVSAGARSLHADFLRDYPEEAVLQMLREKTRLYPDLPCGDLFTGLLHNRLGRMIGKYSRIDANAPLSSLDDAALRRAAAAAKDFCLPVRGTEGFDHAQVTAGGIRTAEFDPRTMESRLVPGLYACGEVLDIDGDCGGFNLQWAWASGRLAGRLGK